MHLPNVLLKMLASVQVVWLSLPAWGPAKTMRSFVFTRAATASLASCESKIYDLFSNAYLFLKMAIFLILNLKKLFLHS